MWERLCRNGEYTREQHSLATQVAQETLDVCDLATYLQNPVKNGSGNIDGEDKDPNGDEIDSQNIDGEEAHLIEDEESGKELTVWEKAQQTSTKNATKRPRSALPPRCFRASKRQPPQR